MKATQRILEIIPGLLIWILLSSPIWGGIFFPQSTILFVTGLTIYWFVRILLISLGSLIGFIKFKLAIRSNWLQKSISTKKKLPKHLIVLANYGEDYATLSKTIKALIAQNYPKELVYLCVSIEERKAVKDLDYAMHLENIKRDFGDFFQNRLILCMHPTDLPNEVPGAASNRTWGAKKAVEFLEDKHEKTQDYIVTAPDSDTILHKEFLACVSYNWLTSKNPERNFYQTGAYTFNNNYWSVPILIRVLSMNLTLSILSSSVFETQKRETFSCYSMSLELLKKVDYWDTRFTIDDTPFYWRPYNYLNGDWHCKTFFIPLSCDALYHPNYFINHIKQYQQYVRWGIGVISFPIGVKTLVLNNKINILRKISKFIHLLEMFVLFKALIYIVIFGIPIVKMVNNTVHLDLYEEVLSIIFFVTTIMGAFLTILRILIAPKKPEGSSLLGYILYNLLEIPTNLIALLTLGSIPYIDATTRVMLGLDVNSVKWTNKPLNDRKPSLINGKIILKS